jgi:PIN domain nuclease of toxin-antitoxin system
VRLLFDTQLWVWIATAPERLPAEARTAFADPANEVAWSVVTIWEIAIKLGLARPDFEVEPEGMIAFLRSGPFTELPIQAEHALPILGLPKLHTDPFDRLLIAQAMAEGMTLLTTDRKIAAYPGPIRRV